MAIPSIPDAILDLPIDYIADNGTKIAACSSEPGTYAAIAGLTLGQYTLTAGAGNGDWVKGNGDTSGRKLTLLAQTGTNATATGDCTCLVVHDGGTGAGAGEILAICAPTTSPTAMTSGVEFQIPEVDVIEWRDPS